MTKYFVIAALLTLLLITTLSAAPIPLKPPLVTSDHLNDSMWTYQYGESIGFICFSKDGTFHSKHQPQSTGGYIGIWYVDRYGIIHIYEHSYYEGSPPNTHCSHYQFQVSTKDFPYLQGKAFCSDPASGTKLILSNPIYKEED